jgi:hypothetical protein
MSFCTDFLILYIFLSFLTVYYKQDFKTLCLKFSLCVRDSNFNKNKKIVHTHVYEPKHHFVHLCLTDSVENTLSHVSASITLKVPKCEIFDPFFFTPINPIWVSDLRTGEKKIFVRRLRQIFAILFFLRRLSVR